MKKLTLHETIDLIEALAPLKKLGMSVDKAINKLAMLEDKKFRTRLNKALGEFNKFNKASFEMRAKMLGIKLTKNRRKG